MKKVTVFAFYAFTMLWFSQCKQGREAVAGADGPAVKIMEVGSASAFANARTYGSAGGGISIDSKSFDTINDGIPRMENGIIASVK